MSGNSSFSPARRSVLVTDAGRGSAIAMIRSLGRSGYDVTAADSAPDSAGFYSRYANERVVYPPPESRPEAFVDALLEVVRRREIDLVIPITDAAILPLAAARERFAGACLLAIPDDAALEVVTNKRKTLELAAELGIPCPRSRYVTSTAEALAAAPGIGWPLVVKPIASRQYRANGSIGTYLVTYAAGEAELIERMRHLELNCPVLLQEYYPGTGCGVELLLHQGTPLAAFQHRRLREVPIYGGASAFRESVALDPQLYHYSLALLQALRWTGLAMVEFKLGTAGPMLMEINGRVWGSLPLALASGVDFPRRLADLYLGGGTTAGDRTAYRTGVRSRNLRLELIWIGTVLRGRSQFHFLRIPGRRSALKAALQLLHPRYRFDVLSLHDPLPGLLELRAILRKFSNRLGRELQRSPAQVPA